jgi:hypothetical protein
MHEITFLYPRIISPTIHFFLVSYVLVNHDVLKLSFQLALRFEVHNCTEVNLRVEALIKCQTGERLGDITNVSKLFRMSPVLVQHI